MRRAGQTYGSSGGSKRSAVLPRLFPHKAQDFLKERVTVFRRDRKAAAAGMGPHAVQKWNRPVLHREEETWEAVRFMDEAGREINAIARDFNSGYGTAEQLRHAICLLRDVYERLRAVRKMGYLHAA